MAGIYSNGGNRWNICGFNFTKRDMLSSVYKISMIPARRDGILTEIPLVLQMLKSVYMILSLILPRPDLGNRCRDPA
jgi:hypothetical protein